MDNIKEKILDVLKHIRGDATLSVEGDTHLFDSGLLDSYDLLRFINELEQVFSMTLLNNDLSASDLNSINSAAQLIGEKSGALST